MDTGETIVTACGGIGVWGLAIINIIAFSDLAQPLKDLLNAMIERYRAKTEAIKKKNKEAQQ